MRDYKNTIVKMDAPYALAYGDVPGIPKVMFMDNLNQWHYTFMQNDYDKILDM